MFNIDVDDKKFNKKLDEVIDKLLPEAVMAGLTEAALLVEGSAKQKCPVDDGILRASITHYVEKDNAVIGTNTDYAPYTHEGTGIYASKGHGRMTPWRYQSSDGQWHTTEGQKPKPFLKEAIEENRKDILQCFENKLGGGSV